MLTGTPVSARRASFFNKQILKAPPKSVTSVARCVALILAERSQSAFQTTVIAVEFPPAVFRGITPRPH